MQEIKDSGFKEFQVEETGSAQHWNVTIIGPSNTPYENGKFKLECIFGKQFPFKPPKIRMDTKIFHVNINHTGKICIDSLLKGWNKEMTFLMILQDIKEILEDPDVASSINDTALQIYATNMNTYNQIAAKWSIKFANGNGGNYLKYNNMDNIDDINIDTLNDIDKIENIDNIIVKPKNKAIENSDSKDNIINDNPKTGIIENLDMYVKLIFSIYIIILFNKI